MVSYVRSLEFAVRASAKITTFQLSIETILTGFEMKLQTVDWEPT